MPPTSEQLLKQAIRLARGQFDMRCARAAADLLVDRHDDHGPLAYGLLTGMVASYARPFTQSNEFGRLDGKWSRFGGMPHLKRHHDELLKMRRTLLAHNDLTEHRATIVWTRGAFFKDRPTSVEARSPINAPGISETRELFRFQEERFGKALDKLIEQLQTLLGWPDASEIDLGLELERLTAEQSHEDFYAKDRRKPELKPDLPGDSPATVTIELDPAALPAAGVKTFISGATRVEKDGKAWIGFVTDEQVDKDAIRLTVQAVEADADAPNPS
jgi:hypothetical protein